ncbi:hypothetical protein [Mesorhizobium sp.]|uniref:hypothetical protein n=1 Tax=Mesorhizobium sp. TaxID=1871066 RepID=UPI000FE6F473|nr:hypothetical protein [Mesorhizobium sp.]RWO20695.1 MAG: hypothetical protein EOS09_26625 [Mesorhizobium sp.]
MDGDLWRPANEKADLAFSQKWCVHCLELSEAEPWEDEFGQEHPASCVILNMAVWGDKPHQLKIRNGEPICTAYREDASFPMRCPHTLELFP